MTDTEREQNRSRCEICTSQIPSDVDVCPVCGAQVERPEQDEEQEITWEIVRVVSTAIEAELMAGRLRSHGIPAIVLSQVDTTRNFTIGALAVAKVFVPDIYLDRAERMLSVDADQWEEEDDDGEHDGNDDQR